MKQIIVYIGVAAVLSLTGVGVVYCPQKYWLIPLGTWSSLSPSAIEVTPLGSQL